MLLLFDILLDKGEQGINCGKWKEGRRRRVVVKRCYTRKFHFLTRLLANLVRKGSKKLHLEVPWSKKAFVLTAKIHNGEINRKDMLFLAKTGTQNESPIPSSCYCYMRRLIPLIAITVKSTITSSSRIHLAPLPAASLLATNTSINSTKYSTLNTTQFAKMSSSMARGYNGRIEAAFAAAKDRGEAAFVTFVTAGFPTKEGELRVDVCDCAHHVFPP